MMPMYHHSWWRNLLRKRPPHRADSMPDPEHDLLLREARRQQWEHDRERFDEVLRDLNAKLEEIRSRRVGGLP